MAVRKKKPEYHHGDLHQALVAATLSLARKKGARAVTLSEAAKEAGVSVAAPYRHFADKEALLAAAAEESYLMFETCLARATATGSALERCEQLALAYLRFFAEHPERIELMFGIGLKQWEHEGLLKASLAAFQRLQSVVNGLADEGILAPETVGRRAYMFWYLMHGHATLGVGRVGPDTPEPMKAVLESVHALIRGFAADDGQKKKKPR